MAMFIEAAALAGDEKTAENFVYRRIGVTPQPA
jgi:hypothetical protein